LEGISFDDAFSSAISKRMKDNQSKKRTQELVSTFDHADDKVKAFEVALGVEKGKNQRLEIENYELR